MDLDRLQDVCVKTHRKYQLEFIVSHQKRTANRTYGFEIQMSPGFPWLSTRILSRTKALLWPHSESTGASTDVTRLR